MKIRYSPAGGRFGYGFNYWCVECGYCLGNSLENETLHHPETDEEGMLFRKKTVPIKCSHVGENYEKPSHEIEVKIL